MEYIDKKSLEIAKVVEEARLGQEEQKSMRNNRQLKEASDKFSRIMQDIVRHTPRRKGQYHPTDKQLHRIIARHTNS